MPPDKIEELKAALQKDHPGVLTAVAMLRAELVKAREYGHAQVSITGDSRLEALPEVPTFEESGIRNMNLYAWWGIFGPIGMPQAIVRKLDDGKLSTG